MKRLLLPLLITVFLGLACPFSGGIGIGSQVDALLSDPQAGLAGLHNYTASLTISFTGTQDGQTVNSTDTYVQTEWPARAANFTVFDSADESGVRQVIMVGAVGKAQYFQAASEAPCTVAWGAAIGGGRAFRLASLLPVVGTARLTGEETLDGIASLHYTFEAAALNLPADATAEGEAWIAKDGGYVVKYNLDISGSDSVFGESAQGTRHTEYVLSQVEAQPEVVYPPGCEPVLDLPALDDASDLIRMPGLLAYNTNAAPETIFTFYEEKLVVLGWELRMQSDLDSDSPSETFIRADTGAGTIIAVSTEGSTRRVAVLVPYDGGAGVPESTPGAQETAIAQNPTVRVALAMNILFNMVPSQPGPASYHLEVVNRIPAWDGVHIAQSEESMSADVEGGKVHFTQLKTPMGGSTTTFEAYLIDDQEYVIEEGQVQLPTADSLTWMIWSANLASILSTSSPGATSAGTEVLEGRSAEIYELNSTGLTIPGIPGTLLSITSVTGTVWVDQETGALLKAELEYQSDVADTHGNPVGSGDGRLEITVTQVGDVTVTLP